MYVTETHLDTNLLRWDIRCEYKKVIRIRQHYKYKKGIYRRYP